jgi:hypothetical protein
MLVTNHVLAGAAVGAVLRRPVASFVVGVASHFVMDAIPHWGVDLGDHDHFFRIAVRDGLSGLTALGLLATLAPGPKRVSVLAGAAGAAFPDLDKPFMEATGRQLWPRSVNDFHTGIQRESSRRMPQEFLVGLVLAAVLKRLLAR